MQQEQVLSGPVLESSQTPNPSPDVVATANSSEENSKLSSLAYDSILQRYIGLFDEGRSTVDQSQEKNIESGAKLYFIDDQGHSMNTLTIRSIEKDRQRDKSYSENIKNAEFSSFNKAQPSKAQQDMGICDQFNILRFIKSHKTKSIDFSPSGLSVKYVKGSTKQKSNEQNEELILTNMAFSSGLHYWEFIAPISQMGVYNPVTKKELLNSFKTSTMRVITVCLDFNDETLKFWLNDRRTQNKTLKLPKVDENCGPWIPCVKLTGEKNRIILNPFAKEPSDFYEKDFDKKFSLKKFIMPLLHNMICITKIPEIDEQGVKVVQKLQEVLKFNQLEVQTILMPWIAQENKGDENNRFCFIKFYNHNFMAEFIRKSNNLQIYQQGQIASWILKDDIESLDLELQKPTKQIIISLNIPSSDLEILKQSFVSIYETITHLDTKINKVEKEQNLQHSGLKLTQQPFSDKLIVIQDNQFVKSVSRDIQTQEFEIDQACFKEGLLSLDSFATLKIEKVALFNFFFDTNWGLILKEEDKLVQGLVSEFLTQASQSMKDCGQYASIEVNIVTAKYVLDLALKHMRSQLDKLKRLYQNNSSIIPSNSLIHNIKIEQSFDLLNDQPFTIRQDLSVDQMHAIIYLLSDAQEQLWAQTRGPQIPADVKNFLKPVSRPHSALNRLGSYISWSISNAKSHELADMGFIYKENMTLNLVDNLSLELQDLEKSQIYSKENLISLYGHGNRLINGDITENIPLSRSLNYLPARNYQSVGRIVDIISSQNNVYTLTVFANGKLHLNNSILDQILLRQVNLFGQDSSTDKKIISYLQKIKERIKSLKDYNKSMIKKLVPLSILKAFKIPIQKSTFKDKQSQLQTAFDKKKQKKINKTNKLNKKQIVADEVVMAESDEDTKLEKTQIQKSLAEQKIETIIDLLKTEDIQISGYFLLTKPYYEKAFDPIIVGTIFQNLLTKKFYIRATKLTFSLGFLHCLIHIDQTSGLLYNRLTGKQIEDCEDLRVMYEDILNSNNCIQELYTNFVFSNKTLKGSPFLETSRTTIEIENCTEIIDFTKCSYSILEQERIHLLVKNDAGKTTLLQYYLKSEELNSQMNIQFKITRGKEMEVDNDPVRVFQYDKNLALVSKEQFSIIDQSNFKVELTEKLCATIQDLKLVDIVNTSDKAETFNIHNSKKYSSCNSIPQQKWQLLISQLELKSIHHYSLDLQGYQNKEITTEQVPQAQSQEINLFDCEASDILQIPNLLQSQLNGVVPKKNDFSLLSSSLIDENSNSQINHNWHITKSSNQNFLFEFEVPNQKADKLHIKQIEVEISLIKTSNDSIRLRLEDQSSKKQFENKGELVEQHLPLIVDYNSGAQINDALLSCYMTNPDSTVFCTNYPKPEFIFKHIHSHSFIPTQFVIRSKSNREWSGVPIGSGMIFVSNSYQDILNTKQFSKFSKQDYLQWRQTRDQLKDIPLLPNEPVAFFEMGEDEEIIVDVKISHSYKYIKLIPVSFRERPINYTSKPFNSNQLEIQFFGVNGYDIGDSFDRNSSQSVVEKIQELLIQEDLEVQFQGKLEDKNHGIITEFEKVHLSNLKGPRTDSSQLNLTSLLKLDAKTITFQANMIIKISEDLSDKVSNFQLFLQQPLRNWLISDVSIRVCTYAKESAIFKSQILEKNKPKLRQYLLDDNKFPELLKQLIQLSLLQEPKDIQKKQAALQCMLSHLKNNNSSDILKLIQSQVKVESYLTNNFFDLPRSLQSITIEYLKQLGLISTLNSQNVLNFIYSQLDQILLRSRQMSQVEQVLSFSEFLNYEDKITFNQKLLSILQDDIIKEKLPIYQTEEYIKLRSKYNINSFPFEKGQIQENLNYSQANELESASNLRVGLPAHMIVTKYNSLNQYTIDFQKNVNIDQLTLNFEQELKCLYKIVVRIIIPDQQGREQVIFNRLYDEVHFQQLCEKAENPKILGYFNEKPQESHSSGNDGILFDKEDLGLNKIKILIDSQTTRFMKIQIEFLDTYRTINKQISMTQIFVRPEFFGQIVHNQQSNYQIDLERYKLFRITEDVQQQHKVAVQTFKNSLYTIYLMASSQLSTSSKQCKIIIEYPNHLNKDKSQAKENLVDDQSLEEVQDKLGFIESSQEELAKALKKKNQAKMYIRVQSHEITNQLQSIQNKYQQDIGLKYLLRLSETLTGKILQINNKNLQLLNIKNITDLYLGLFKRFSVFDNKALYPNIHKFLDLLFEKIENKSSFICSLFSDYLLQSNTNYSQKNVINFIKTMKNVDLNDLFLGFAQLFKLDIKDEDLMSPRKIAIQDIDKIIVRLNRDINQSRQIQTQAILAFLTILDDLTLDENLVPFERLRIDILIRIITQLIENSQELINSTNQNDIYVIQYAQQVIKKYLSLKGLKVNEVIARCQIDIIFMKVLVLKKNNKIIQKEHKLLLQSLASHDTNQDLLNSVTVVLNWFQQKENEVLGQFYKNFGLDSNSLYYRHLVQIFKLLSFLQKKSPVIKLQDEKQASQQTSLGTIANDLLRVLIENQNDEKYEENFFFIWTELFSQVLKNQNNDESNKNLGDKIIQEMFKLNPVTLETLYPTLVLKAEKIFKAKSGQVSNLISILKHILKVGFTEEPLAFQVLQSLSTLKENAAYNFADNLLNIMLTSVPNKSKAISVFIELNSSTVKELLQVLTWFIKTHVNDGNFSGINGVKQSTNLKLKLSVSMSSILILGQTDSDSKSYFTLYVDNIDDDFESLIDSLIQWSFNNSITNKNKSSPSGQLIVSLSQQVDTLLQKVASNEQAVQKCLPILMKNVLKIDYKLRDLVLIDKVNQGKAIQIQKNVNELFLQYFKSWISTDQVAQSFLTELQGFDFLLDRLFSKDQAFPVKQIQEVGVITQATTSNAAQKQDEKKEQDELEQFEGLNDAESDDANDFDDEDSQILKLVLEKLKVKQPQSEKQKKSADKIISDKKKLKKLPTMIKQEGVVSSEKVIAESNDNDPSSKIELKLNVDDWGKNLQLVSCSDKKPVAQQHDPQIWIKYRTGMKYRVNNCILSDEALEHELIMEFDLQQVIQISEVQVGVVFNWTTYDQDQNYEPLTLIIEGGVSKDQADFKAIMSPLRDYGYETNQIRPYGAILYPLSNKLAQHENFENQISCYKKIEARYLKLRFRRVVQINLESSIHINQVAKPKSYGLSYFSIMGNQPIKSNQLYHHMLDLQKENSLEVLSKFFSGEFTQAFEIISEQPQIIQKIKNAYDKLAILLDQKADLIKPIFLAICSKNEELSDWILQNRLLKIDPELIKKEQIKFLGDIISSNKEIQYLKLLNLKEFIFQSVEIYINEGQNDKTKLKLLQRFMKLFTNKIREYSNYLVDNSNENCGLEILCEIKDIKNCLSLLNQSDEKDKSFENSLITYILLFVCPPTNFVNNTLKPQEIVIRLLSDSNDQTLLTNKLFASIIANTDTEALGYIVSTLNIVQDISDLLNAQILNQGNQREIFLIAQYIYNCCSNQVILDQIVNDQQYTKKDSKEGLMYKIYEFISLQGGDSKVLLNAQQTLTLLIDSLKEILINCPSQQARFSTILQEDMRKSSEVGDVQFISKVIVPILHSEKLVNISIYDQDADQPQRLKPFFQGGKCEIQKDQFFLKTQLLSQKQRKTLENSFISITQDKIETNKLLKSKWEMIYSEQNVASKSQTDFLKFVKSVSNKSNIMILLKSKVNEQEVIFGGYTAQPFPNLDGALTQEFDYQIPFDEANFVFSYYPDKELNFTMTHNKAFGYVYTDYNGSGALSISGDFFLISWSHEFSNTCGNIYDMKCIEDPAVVTMYNNMTILELEVWYCDQNQKAVVQGQANLKKELKHHPYYHPFNPQNYFNENLIFKVSEEMSLQDLGRSILGKKTEFINRNIFNQELDESTHRIKDVIGLGLDKETLNKTTQIHSLIIKKSTASEKEDQKDSDKKQSEEALNAVQNSANKPILKLFIDKGGIIDLLQAAKTAVSQYSNEEIKNLWTLWLQEIESFNGFDNFFQLFTQDKTKEDIIYSLLSGENDCKLSTQNAVELKKKIKNQEDLHLELITYTYKILSKVFESQENSEMRNMCLKSGTFLRFIERIGQLSSEKKRVKIEKNLIERVEESETIQQKEKSEEQKKKNTFEQDKNKVRKGVGYTTGVGTAWNVSEYLKSKESKNQQVANIMNILTSIIKSQDWQAPQEVKEMILESALLPALEAGLRSGSLLEMAKDFELNMAYLDFVTELSNHNQLIDLLLDIGDEYEPRQKETIYELLKKIGGLSSIFLSCLNTDSADKSQDTEDSKKPKQLAEKIQETLQVVENKLKASQSLKNQQSLLEILEMPLSEAYHKLLSDLRFENMNMKNSSGIYQHYYVHDIPKGLNPPVAKLVRLAQEIADLSNSLPCDWTNAIFCRVDQERVDVMKCMIMGASGTPYAHGAFIYDLFFENTYPNGPPKCTLVTTGGGTVRFNPNLYTNGKVCLSLLGTWRGSSTENWDPKLSTILQVLLSVQAIIMSNEVYFNEPGYEHEQGTVEGERKNEGYANIVRYCNIKFAMIDAIKNPPPGFEKVVKRSFYLKKNEILREVKEWVDRAKISDATYQGLVYDHNYHWAPQISPEGKYAEMMDQIYKELKETLESIPSPFEDESGNLIQRKFSTQEIGHDDESTQKKDVKISTELVSGTNMQLDDIDVSFATSSQEVLIDQNINVEDEKVKDRWSRYIGAMGIEAVAKQAQSRVLIHGLDALGVEIAKNIILAGCKELILEDKEIPLSYDVNGQFFIEEKDISKFQTLDQITTPKLQQLNYYVKVSTVPENKKITDFIKDQVDLKVVVITKLCRTDLLYEINQICRDKGISFIYAAQNGVMSKVFTDFGPEFIVLDKDGEELQEVLIKDISFDEKSNSSVVTLLEGYKHKYQDGDVVIFKEIIGMHKLIKSDIPQSLNNQTSKITVINPTSFKLNEVDVREYSKYEGSGIAKQIKVPVKLNFLTLDQVEALEQPPIDQNLSVYDFTKMEKQLIIHEIYKQYQYLIMSLQEEDIQYQITEIFTKLFKEEDSEDRKKKVRQMVEIFLITVSSQLPPACAFLGGVVSQEIVKAITQKYMPISQLFYFDCIELFQIDKLQEMIVNASNQQDSLDKVDNYQRISYILGDELMQKVFNCKLFMIGAGAIGCELLKNYAMLGLGTGPEGQIIVTDPDVIEVSNLNRQFLFREKHLRKPKSSTAAAAAIQMNLGLKNHIKARLDKIHDGTAHIYNERFFTEQTIVTNALDNVAARLYIDGKCVSARTTLIDSGTLGPKGHVQIVLPKYQTESYASQNDPEDNTEIPHCTLKMFPEEVLHCIEWAKDIFGKLYTIQPQVFNKYLESDSHINFADQQEITNLKKALKTLNKEPNDFRECIALARSRFQKHFVNDIKQLLHVYPIDKVTKDGRPFWSLPKRPPHSVEFDLLNNIHVSFVSACACLYATVYDIEIPYKNPRSQEAKQEIAQIAAEFKQPEFLPNDLKASEIQSQVEKDPTKDAQSSLQDNNDEEDDIPTLIDTFSNDKFQSKQQQELQELKQAFEVKFQPLREVKSDEKQKILMKVQEFEKDNDTNYHIDFIYSMANIRAQNYNLDGMEWIDVKIKAGRIIPALATTTAAIAGLQTLEVLKYLKGCKLEEHRYSFMNLAVPSLMMSEPGPALKTKLIEGLEVTLWDRWEYDASQNPDKVTLLDVLNHVENKYKLKSRDVFYGSLPLFLHALEGRDETSRTKNLSSVPLVQKISKTTSTPEKKEVPDFIDLTITFVEEGKVDENGQEKKLDGVPQVRVLFIKIINPLKEYYQEANINEISYSELI